MNQRRIPRIALGAILLTQLGTSHGQAQAPPLEGPLRSGSVAGNLAPIISSTPHESITPLTSTTSSPRIAQAPPPPVDEPDRGERPGPSSVWIDGHWDWDTSLADFVWASGEWREPPPGKIWLNGAWRRDNQGWYRVPGLWIDGPTARVERPTTAADLPRVATDWRTQGPPAERPETTITAAPETNTFWIPGRWAPDGESQVVWRPGFWTRNQAGWDWLPGHWVRRADGWAYVDGRWDRVAGPETLADPSQAERYTVARPPFEADPADNPRPSTGIAPYVDPYGRRLDRSYPGGDPIAEAESGLPPYGRYAYPPPIQPRGYFRPPFGPAVPIYGPRDAMNITRSILDQFLP